MAKSVTASLPRWSSFWRDHAPAAVVLFAVGLVVRASLLVQVSRTPFFQARNIHSEAYQLWAVRIAAGHVLSTEA